MFVCLVLVWLCRPRPSARLHVKFSSKEAGGDQALLGRLEASVRLEMASVPLFIVSGFLAHCSPLLQAFTARSDRLCSCARRNYLRMDGTYASTPLIAFMRCRLLQKPALTLGFPTAPCHSRAYDDPVAISAAMPMARAPRA